MSFIFANYHFEKCNKRNSVSTWTATWTLVMVYSTLEWNADRQTVQHALATTRYNCTDLVCLNGGVTNFTYRGTLASLLPDGTRMVTIKHAESIIRQEFTLDARRSVCYCPFPMRTAPNSFSFSVKLCL